MKNKLNPYKIIIIVSFTLITFAVILFAFVTLGIGSHYHPNAYEAYYGLKYYPVFLFVLLANWFIAVIYNLNKSKFSVFYIAYLILGLTIGLYFILESVPTNKIEYLSLKGDNYSIPVTYNPSSSEESWGGYINVEVDYPSFQPIYSTTNSNESLHISLNKHTNIFKAGLLDYEANDMLENINEDMRTKINDTNLRIVYSKRFGARQYFYILDQSGKIIYNADCFKVTRSCDYRFTDGKYAYELNLDKDQIENTQIRESIEKKVIDLFEKFRTN